MSTSLRTKTSNGCATATGPEALAKPQARAHTLRGDTVPRYHAHFDPPPEPKSQLARCHCGEMVLMKPGAWLEPDDEGTMIPHLHQPAPPPTLPLADPGYPPGP